MLYELTDPPIGNLIQFLKGIVTDKNFDKDYPTYIAFRGDRQYIEIEASAYKSYM